MTPDSQLAFLFNVPDTADPRWIVDDGIDLYGGGAHSPVQMLQSEFEVGSVR